MNAASSYAGLGDGAFWFILIASIISAPAAITVARLMIPESGEPTAAELELGEGPTSAMTRPGSRLRHTSSRTWTSGRTG